MSSRNAKLPHAKLLVSLVIVIRGIGLLDHFVKLKKKKKTQIKIKVALVSRYF